MTNHRTITCDTVDELLSQYLEHELAPAARASVDGHLATCTRCSSLVHDLQNISTAAAALPELRLSRDLWDGIAAQIEAPVLSISNRASASAPSARRSYFRFGAIAAGLMAITAGATYMLTARTLNARTAEQIAAAVDSVRARTTRDSVAPSSTQVVASNTDSTTQAADRGVQTVANPAGVTARQRLDLEIAQLQLVLVQRRTELDPKTLAILSINLSVIDQAIAESQTALARDPASRFLSQQLTRTLDRKLELLRTAALIPARS